MASDMAHYEDLNDRTDGGGKDRGMAKIEGTRSGQRLLADHTPGVQHGAGRVHRLVPTGATARFHQGHGQRVADITRGPRPRLLVDHYPDVSYPQAGGRSIRQWATCTRAGPRHLPREEREVDRHPYRQLAHAATSPGAPQHAG